MKLKYLLLLLIVTGACSNKDTKQDQDYNLVSSGKIKTFNLDSDVNYRFLSLFSFVENGRYYINFLNYRKNQVLFYDFEDSDPFFRLELEEEGPDGVGKAFGLWANGFNEIYTTCFERFGITMVDTTGKVRDFIKYNSIQGEKEVPVVPSFQSQSFYYTPLFKIEGKYFIVQPVVRFLPIEESRVTVTIDSLTRTAEALPFGYPDFMFDPAMDFAFADFSREFDGERFIYSFILDENIYVTNIDHTEVKVYPGKSKYINKINPYEKIPRDHIGNQRNYERPFYHNLVYDKYREVYYRFILPEVEVSPKLDFVSVLSQGRKQFAIMILDKEFNIIGETFFPQEFTYVSHVFFIHPDGLYICNNHVLNENFNEDVLSFECFELVKTFLKPT